MNKRNVETIIKDLFSQNYTSYEENYPLEEVFPDFINTGSKYSYFIATEEATTNVQNTAINYFENRSKEEIERDEQLGITQIDYVEWCMEKFATLIP